MDLLELNEVIEDLNNDLYEKFGDDVSLDRLWGYETVGYYTLIKFGEFVLWNSEDDEREWIEDKNDYEPMKPFLIRKLNEEIDKLVEYKFNEEISPDTN